MVQLVIDNVRWVLFDAVGTLLYPDPPVAEAYLVAARQFGSQLTIESIRLAFADALKASFATNAPTSEANERSRWRAIVSQVINDVPQGIDGVFDCLWNHFAQAEHWRLYDDVALSLTNLRSRGFRLGIASNFDGRLNNIVAGHPELASCDAVFVSSDLGFSKPDRSFFRAIEKQLGVDSKQILLVGDDEACDVQAALAAGWQAILIDRERKCLGGICSLNELVNR